MSEPFLAEIKIIGFNFPPRGWAYCDGQILPINQNQSLYSLLGTTYGGDGRTSFALPDLRSRTPFHRGDGYNLGRKTGGETVTLVAAEMAAHNHAVKSSPDQGNKVSLGNQGNLFFAADPEGDPIYRSPEAANAVTMRKMATHAGGGQAHNNMQPSLVLGFVIALKGLFPSRN